MDPGDPKVPPEELRREHLVGTVAAVSMWAATVLVILQLLVWIPVVLVHEIFPQLGERAGMALAGALELGLILSLARRMKSMLGPDGEGLYVQTPEGRRPAVFSESLLEKGVGITAAGALAWCLLLGMRGLALQVALTVVEGFAALYMAIFILARWSVTRETRPGALAAFALTLLSLGRLLR